MKLRIRELRSERGLTLQELAAEAGVSRSYLNELELGMKTINAARLRQIAAALDVSVTDLIEDDPAGSMVAVAGKVGAGALVDLVDAYEKGDGLYHVACPPQLRPHDIVAVEVKGDSMAPVYQPGDVLFYAREAFGVPTEAIGRICVAEDEDGRVWVKEVRIGAAEGTFSLLSINPQAEHRHGVKLKWAAPVRMSLSADLVKRVE